MSENFLLKKANPKVPIEGFYPEAIGGGDPEEAKQLGGRLEPAKEPEGTPKSAYWAGDIHPKIKGDMSSVYSQQYAGGYHDTRPAEDTLKHFVEKDMGIKRHASLKVGQRRSKMAENPEGYPPEDENALYAQDEAEFDQVALEDLQETHRQMSIAIKQKDMLAYDRLYSEAKELIQSSEAAREYAQEHMLSVPSPQDFGVDPKTIKDRRSKGIRDAVNTYMPEHDKSERKLNLTKEDKAMLHGMGIKSSVKVAWDRAISDGSLQFSSNRYSFGKNASEEIRTGFKPLVAKVNRNLNRLHIPKRAGAHEAAMKEIAKRASVTDKKFNRIASFADALMSVTAAAKPKCPHCGSTKYALMPTDFETAKCDECGKNWDHGIVEGINDPGESKTAGTKLKWIVSPPPTGRYRSFDTRSWPEASYPDGAPAVALYCDKDYSGRTSKEEGLEITIRIADHSAPSNTQTGKGFTWRTLKARGTSLLDAKMKAQAFIDGHPEFQPKVEPKISSFTTDVKRMKAIHVAGGKTMLEEDTRPVRVFLEPDEIELVSPKTASKHHCARTECKCGAVTNCRCDAKKETKYVDSCGACEGKTASTKIAASYPVVKEGNNWYIKGLPSENYDGEPDPDSMILPGMYYSMDTPNSIAEGIYVSLYDELQTNDNLKEGDIFETQVGQFIVKGVHVFPHDEKARAAIDAVHEQYKCANCECDRADHPGGENCVNHPECTQYKSRSEDGV